MRTLEEVLADARGEAQVLRKHGQGEIATAIENLCYEVAVAAEPWTVWLSETKAQLRSDKSIAWLRARFSRWQSEGLARWNPHAPNERQYLQCAIPLAAEQVNAIEADAREEARKAS